MIVVGTVSERHEVRGVAETRQPGQARARLTRPALLERLVPQVRAAVAAFRAATPDGARQQLRTSIARASGNARVFGLAIVPPPLGYEKSFRHLLSDRDASRSHVIAIEGPVSDEQVATIARLWNDWHNQEEKIRQDRSIVRTEGPIVVTTESGHELIDRILALEGRMPGPPAAGADPTVDFE